MSVVCKGITKAGIQCKKRTLNPNNYCSVHSKYAERNASGDDTNTSNTNTSNTNTSNTNTSNTQGTYKFIYSRSKQEVTVTNEKRNIRETLYINDFIHKYVMKYRFVVTKNPYNLTKADIDYFMSKYVYLTKEKTKKEILAEIGISSKADYLKWVVKTHPDRGGSEEMFKKYFEMAREIYSKI